ncbi:MAG TPA: ATP-binding domain-containing protein [Mycobacteriales bacterium]|nr:ATP-binding domain-containing protein [Mycobacteriales bacterium]
MSSASALSGDGEAGAVGVADRDLDREQDYLSMLYERVDGLREHAGDRLAAVLLQTGGTPQQRSQRDAAIGHYTDQVAQFEAVEGNLCFGRLDLGPGRPDGSGESGESGVDRVGSTVDGAPARRYIGRIGILDEAADYEPLLVDWRAPAARPFYLATAAAPLGVTRRRHIRTLGRRVVGLDDEVLDVSAAAAGSSRREELTGEAALLAALNASRTGRMRDIVETIQAEQDEIIRADPAGLLVVQGGPGTGKTAVALHRAAYLLYTYREELSARGVLIVGPNPTYLRYISQVLPALAETGVLLRTAGELYPGVVAGGTEPDAAAEVKGRLAMTGVLAAAVADRQRVPDEPLEIVIASDTTDRDTLTLDPAACAAARDRARRTGQPHNLARQRFDLEIVHALSVQLGDRIGADPYANDPLGEDDAPGDENVLEEADLAEIRRELRADPGVLTTLDWLWPILNPEQLLTDLYAAPDRIATAAPGLTAAEQALLARDLTADWTPADVPLLDELAELLGQDDRDLELLAEHRHRQQVAYAEGALEIMHGSRPLDLEDEIDPDILTAADLLDSGQLSERQADANRLTAAERAAADRTWTFGHIIVDEAQELSPMAWRLLMRRCPSRSMTLVGDVAQTSDPAGTSAWAATLGPYVADRWRLTELTVNYRTPAEIIALAGRLLAGIDPALRPPRSVRETGAPPRVIGTDRAGLTAAVVAAVRDELGRVGDGRIGVLVPPSGTDLAAVLAGALPAGQVDADLDSPVAVLTVRQAKGLEFDTAVVVDPAAILAESARGASDLYVALTRPTQRLILLHANDLPPALAAPTETAPTEAAPAEVAPAGGSPGPGQLAGAAQPSR